MQTFKFWSLTVGRPSQFYENINNMRTVMFPPIAIPCKNISGHHFVGFRSKNSNNSEVVRELQIYLFIFW